MVRRRQFGAEDGRLDDEFSFAWAASEILVGHLVKFPMNSRKQKAKVQMAMETWSHC